MKALSVVVALFVLVALAQAATSKKGPCSNLASPSNPKQHYDLSSLAGKIFTATTADGVYTFTWAVCGTVTCNDDPNAAVCQNSNTGFRVVGAEWNPGAVQTIDPAVPGTGIGVVYTNSFDRKIDAVVVCDKKAKTPINFSAVFPSNTAQPTILTFSHVSGCPVHKGLSAGWICFILVIVALVLYFILGFLWNRFREGKEGFSAVPNFLWAELPGLCADGFRFLVSKIRGTPSNYETVA